MSEESKPLGELTGGTVRPAEAVGDKPTEALMSIREAAAAFGVSADTVRRLIKAEQREPGKGLRHTSRPSKRGDEYAIAPADLEALGYARPKAAAERVEEARRDLAAEEAARKVAAAETRAEVAALRAQFLEQRTADLEKQLAETSENLRKAIERIPLALPPAPPSLLGRLFGKRKA